MVKHALREGSACCRQSECVRQSERLRDWQEGGHICQRCALDGLLGLYLTAALREALVDTTDGIAGTLDLHQEDRLLEARLSCQLSCVHGSASRWNDLVATSVSIVLMRHHIDDVIAGTSLVLVRQDALLGDPLEACFDRVTDLSQVLCLLGAVDEYIFTSGLWTETPDLFRVIWVPFELVL